MIASQTIMTKNKIKTILIFQLNKKKKTKVMIISMFKIISKIEFLNNNLHIKIKILIIVE